MLVSAARSAAETSLLRMLQDLRYQDSARKALRAMVMLWNFHPYGRKVQAKSPHSQSPFENLNGFRYHDNWLRNMFIASSFNGCHIGKPVPYKSMEN
jgi:hypothetical protein